MIIGHELQSIISASDYLQLTLSWLPLFALGAASGACIVVWLKTSIIAAISDEKHWTKREVIAEQSGDELTLQKVRRRGQLAIMSFNLIGAILCVLFALIY